MTPEQRRLALRILDAAERQVIERAGSMLTSVVAQTDAAPVVMSRLWHEVSCATAQTVTIQAARVAVLQGGGE